MNINTKAKISQATLSTLSIVAVLMAFGVVTLVICAGIGLNPFREATTTFLIASFIGLIGFGTVVLFLNVAVNLSIVADAKLIEFQVNRGDRWSGRWLLIFGGATALLTAVIAGGAFYSKRTYMEVVRAEADEILVINAEMVNKIGSLVDLRDPDRIGSIKEIRRILRYLQAQRANIPSITLIIASNFEGKPVEVKIWADIYIDELRPNDSLPYYTCNKSIDCDYIQGFFRGETREILTNYSMRTGEFYIYKPIILRDSKFIFLFERHNSYGKLGS